MAENDSSALPEEEFICAHFDDYLSDSLSTADMEKFRSLLRTPKYEQHLEHLQKAIGGLQMGLQSYFLSEDQRVELHDIVENSELRRTREAKRIEELSKWEAVADFRKRLSLVVFVLALTFGVIYYFTPKKKIDFDPLQSLAYEALVLEERGEDRLDLPTHDIQQLNQFLLSYKGLNYKPHPLVQLPADLKPDGATVIDYDSVRIVTVQYSNSRDEKLFYFNFPGKVEQLPKANPFLVENLTFYPYVNDTYNIICWQLPDNVVGMMIGRKSSMNMAEIISAGM